MAWQKLSNIKGDKGDPGPGVTGVAVNTGGTLDFMLSDGSKQTTPVVPSDVVKSTLSPISGGKDYGKVGAGALTLDPTVGTHVFDATGAVLVTLPATNVNDFAFFTVTCASGGANVTWQADSWPLGQPTAADVMTVNFQRVRGQWWGFGTGAGVAATPDTTPPSPPTLTVKSHTYNTVTLTVSGAVDDVAVTKARISTDGGSTWQVFSLPTGAGDVTVTGLTSSTAYSFIGQAGDKASNWSTSSIAVTATTDVAPPLPHTWTFNGADGNITGPLKSDDGVLTLTPSATNGTWKIAGGSLSVTNGDPGSVVLPAAQASTTTIEMDMSATGGGWYGVLAGGMWVGVSFAANMDSAVFKTSNDVWAVSNTSAIPIGSPGHVVMTFTPNAAGSSIAATLSKDGTQLGTATFSTTNAGFYWDRKSLLMRVSDGSTRTIDNLTITG